MPSIPALVFGALVVIAGAGLARRRVRRRLQSSTRMALRRFRVRLNRYKLVDRRRVRDELINDPIVRAAIAEHSEQHDQDAKRVDATVRDYIDEIVPFFSVLSYYNIGYNLARVLIRMFYRVNVAFRDDPGLSAIPRNDVVVYAMNHRSNADYIVVAYVLAGRVSISYAVGEWARVWPLEYIFKSFGAYFVRRRFREPLYHTVLERYVQLITRNGVTQGVFLEGGLTRDGLLRPPKLGLLDYVVRTVNDPAFTRDVWLVPVAINYDRVLEDRTLIAEQANGAPRPGRLKQLSSVTQFIFHNIRRAVTGNLKRYGRTSIAFGSPRSVRQWASAHPGVFQLEKPARLPVLETLANQVMDDIADIIPVTPVPLVAAVLLTFDDGVIPQDRLLARLADWREHLIDHKREIETELSAQDILDRAYIMLQMRRLVTRHENLYTINADERPLLQYYASSISHLLPDHALQLSRGS